MNYIFDKIPCKQVTNISVPTEEKIKTFPQDVTLQVANLRCVFPMLDVSFFMFSNCNLSRMFASSD